MDEDVKIIDSAINDLGYVFYDLCFVFEGENAELKNELNSQAGDLIELAIEKLEAIKKLY